MAENNVGDSDMPQSPPPQEPDQITTPMVIEAILFAADVPITPNKLSEIVGAGGVREVRNHIDQLNQKYEQMNCSFRIEALAGGYQMLTLSKFNIWLRQLVKVRDETKLTPAALETLAIVAYKQPIIRVDVEAIRGVGCGEMIRQLCDKGLVKIVGRAEVLGRPLLYGTTKKFLEVFGLHNLKDLPRADSLKMPS
ncbi:MAG: SMC-Scp complex subunit ScpB [Planctomycetes bacterium]|nr:SMC-Scp complex subunit ScpB [Planctomycetota bacterium]